jgi:hypothetical protein
VLRKADLDVACKDKSLPDDFSIEVRFYLDCAGFDFSAYDMSSIDSSEMFDFETLLPPAGKRDAPEVAFGIRDVAAREACRRGGHGRAVKVISTAAKASSDVGAAPAPASATEEAEEDDAASSEASSESVM